MVVPPCFPVPSPARSWLCLAVLFSACLLRTAQAEPFHPRSVAYVLQAEGIAKDKDTAVEKLAAAARDLVILDPAFSHLPDLNWTPTDLNRIRAARPGSRILAYISIGEAENYRNYWQKSWDANRDGRPDAGAPSFLNGVNPDWEGNYKVKYWNTDWQEIILRRIREIAAQGFDGLYLDIVDAFEFYEQDGEKYIDQRVNPETGRSYRADMIAWVRRIAAQGRETRPGFLIFPQNGAALLVDDVYRRSIDGIGIEDLYNDGNKTQSSSYVREIEGYLRPLVAEGKPAVVIDYATKDSARSRADALAKTAGLTLLHTDRNLKTLGESGTPAKP